MERRERESGEERRKSHPLIAAALSGLSIAGAGWGGKTEMAGLGGVASARKEVWQRKKKKVGNRGVARVTSSRSPC